MGCLLVKEADEDYEKSLLFSVVSSSSPLASMSLVEPFFLRDLEASWWGETGSPGGHSRPLRGYDDALC
jgi:hypothetical protein